MARIEHFCSFPERDIRSCYYHIGHTDRPAIYKVSNVLPITDKYIDDEYLSQGHPLILRDANLIKDITKKLHRILLTEQKNPNMFEQHITDLYEYLIAEEQKEEADR